MVILLSLAYRWVVFILNVGARIYPVRSVKTKSETPSMHLIKAVVEATRELEKVIVYTSHLANNNIKYLQDL